MGSDKGGAKIPASGGGSDPRARAMLGAVASATNRLTAALNEVGLDQRLRESPSCRLRSLDRSLPDETLADLLLLCEAFATVTGPATLTTGDVSRIRSEAQRIQRRIQTLQSAVRGQRRMTLTGSTSQTRGAFLRSALVDSDVQDALAELLAALSALVALEDAAAEKRKRVLVVGPGCVIPTAVLGGALALIVFLLATIATATGQGAISVNGLNIPALAIRSTTPTATVRATATASPATQRPTATTQSSVATPVVKLSPTAKTMPASGYGALSASPGSAPACQGQNVSFTLAYTGGSSPISWQASGYNTNDIQLSPSAGSLSPGQSVTVNVTVNADSTGSITITPTNGASPTTVSYDSSNC